MTDLVERVRATIDPKCLVKRGLNKSGCRLLMAHVPAHRLIVDFDRPGSPLSAGATRCDYLVLAEDGREHNWVAILELKRGALHADQAVRQLKAGARVAEKLIPPDEAVAFRPVVASRKVSKHERRKLRDRNNMIRFRERKEPIRLTSCGATLMEAL